MSRLRATRLCILLCFVVSAQIILLRSRRQQDATQSDLWGRTTAQQAMTLSAPVFQALLGGQGDLVLSAEPRDMQLHDKHNHRVWSIDGVARRGAATVHLLRDADSGEILVVGCTIHHKYTSPSAIKETAVVATARARAWLSCLGHPAAWHLIGSPRHGDHVWVMDLVTDQRHAMIHIDDEQGDLMSAVIRPL